jgi:hypothetical protein
VPFNDRFGGVRFGPLVGSPVTSDTGVIFRSRRSAGMLPRA